MGESGMEKATLAGGCFWCLEPVFSSLKGVHSVEPGYSGGHQPDPTYRQVCSGRTGHAEAVEITFDPAEISYRDLLQVFFAVHDPTTKDRQGADVGTQYRSAVFYRGPEQRQVAEDVLASTQTDPTWEGNGVVTEVVPFTAFYPAEEEHRRYYDRNPHQPYCRVVITPKVLKFKKLYTKLLT